jgi:Dehydrogenases with different specificities (related to short-chain alcohol dehydrogenases)
VFPIRRFSDGGDRGSITSKTIRARTTSMIFSWNKGQQRDVARVFTSPSPQEIDNTNDNSKGLDDSIGTTGATNHSHFSRRQALSKPFEMALSSLLLAGMATATPILPIQPAMADIQYNDMITHPQTILMTGANSGIGYDAAKRMALQGHTVLLLCRSLSKAEQAASRIRQELSKEVESINVDDINVIPKECNLADLRSIDRFVKELAQDERVKSIDALCLNAGIARNTAAKDVLRTAQNFELTVGTNHLGHFYLTDLILKLPQPSLMKENSRIVVTASGVHDPESPGGAQGSKATLGDLKGLDRAVERGDGVFDMVDGNEMYDPDKAYKDSKLCNVLFMRELQRRLDKEKRKIQVTAFNPGLIVSTGLFRDQNPVFTKVFDFVATDLFRVGETVHWGGGALEYMALDAKTVGSRCGGLYYTSPPGSSKYGDDAYGNQFTVANVSKEASDMEKAKRLWELSEKLVRLQS